MPANISDISGLISSGSSGHNSRRGDHLDR
jgi:hypothetical protein